MTKTQLRDIYSVSRLNREVRSVLETGFPLLWLEGEISNFACPSSGHWYLSLKDSHAQVRCAMFRTRNRSLRFVPRNGMQVIVRAKIGLYEPRGEFQIIIEHMEEAGEGALRQQFEQLKNKLNAQGMFASKTKKTLPDFSKRIGVITSPTGAAIHDVLTTLKRRFASLQVIIYPVSVQGKAAAADISATIKLADKRNECDVLLLTRGGGSLEDLWSFNEENVANAIYNCNIPIISAIGHDVDFSIADFVADVRAATPTAAAELVSPDAQSWLEHTSSLQKRITQLTLNIINNKASTINHLSKRIRHPRRHIEETSQRADEYLYRLQQLMTSRITTVKHKINNLNLLCQAQNPIYKIQSTQQHTKKLLQQLKLVQQQKISTLKQRFIKSTSTLNAVSPLATLERGYAYVTSTETNKVINDIRQLNIGDKVKTSLTNGSFISTVTHTKIKR